MSFPFCVSRAQESKENELLSHVEASKLSHVSKVMFKNRNVKKFKEVSMRRSD